MTMCGDKTNVRGKHNTLHATRYTPRERGIGLLEIVIGVGVITVSLVGIAAAFALYFRAIQTNTEAVRTAYLLEEGVEALRHLRTTGWGENIAPIATSTTYYLAFEDALWKATTTSIVIEEALVRSFVMADIFRDSVSDDIVASTTPDAYFDPDIRHTTMTVTNTETGAETSVETYLVNLFRN